MMEIDVETVISQGSTSGEEAGGTIVNPQVSPKTMLCLTLNADSRRSANSRWMHHSSHSGVRGNVKT